MPSKFKAILVLVPIFLVRSEPVPEALPEAQAEAEAQAEPQSFGYPSYNGGGGMYNMGEAGVMRPEVLPAPVPAGDNGWSSGGGMSQTYPYPGQAGQAGDQCGMVDQCCNMDQQGCCVNEGQKCYTVYETKCKYANKPRCINSFQTKCEKVEIKKCRMVEEIRDITVPFETCKVIKENKCWEYDEHSCKYDTKRHDEPISWTQESLKRTTDPRTICADVKVCKITEVEETQMTKVPERKCDKVPQTRKKCNTVYVPQPPIEQPWTDYVTEYRQQCYEVPKPVCVSKPCSYQLQTTNICPTCVSPGQPGPQCSQSTPCGGGSAPAPLPAPAPDMCGSCRQQNVQMCTKMTQQCSMKTERVCQSVPYRKPVQRMKMIQRPPIPQLKCEDETQYITKCRVEYIEKPNTIKVSKCDTSVEEKCLPYNAPNFEVMREDKEETAQFKVNVCEIQIDRKRHCVDLPTNSTCTGNKITRQVKVKFQKCDRSDYQTVCKKFPEQNCHNSPGQVCWKEPREVCQPTCQDNNFCNTCQQFASMGGFEQCGTPTCPNYIARR